MYKKITPLYLIPAIGSFIILSSNSLAGVLPTDVVARDLNYPGLGWIGHVGLATAGYVWEDADYVVEALNEPLVLQINTHSNFKRRSPYWGAKFGIKKNDASGTRIINEGAFQTSLKCAVYTATLEYKPGTGQWGVPFSCPLFRCDTFINYIYNWGGYRLPTYSEPGGVYHSSLPKLVFNFFPSLRNERLSIGNLNSNISNIIPLDDTLTINNATIDRLINLEFAEFISVIDIPKDKIKSAGIDNLLTFAEEPQLDTQKREFLLDKMGFVASPVHLKKLIELYYKNEGNPSLTYMIIRNTQIIYQQYSLLNKYPEEKAILQNFYTQFVGGDYEERTTPIVLRGLIALSDENSILKNKSNLDSSLSNPLMDKGVKISLKTALALKSLRLEELYIPEILNQLSVEDKAELDILFLGAIAGTLGEKGVNTLSLKSKSLISNYLDSIQFKFEKNYIKRKKEGYVFPQSLGILLEASALLKSSSFSEASRNIIAFLETKPKEERLDFIMGLSQNPYILKAFKEEPILKDFHKIHQR